MGAMKTVFLSLVWNKRQNQYTANGDNTQKNSNTNVTPQTSPIRGNLFSTYTKFSEKLTLLTPWYVHKRVRIRG